MDLLEDLSDPILPISTACQALGVSRATLYNKLKELGIEQQ